MKSLLKLLAALLMLLAPAVALAQSTAQPVVTGYISTSGCPYGQTSCFVQFGASGGAGNPYTIVAPTSYLPYAFNNLDASNLMGSQTAEACHVIKPNPGNIYYLDAHELAAGGSPDFIFVVNAIACPSNGTLTAGTRILSSPALSPSGTWSWTSGSPIPMPASAGIVIVCSTTDWPTLTLDTAHCLFNWGIE
jgi:hypothetical protein